MPRYVIEREIPGAGKLNPDELRGVSEKSSSVLQQMGPQIQWIESYVTADKIYCVYVAPNEEMIRQHAAQGRLPRQQDLNRRRHHQPDDGGGSRLTDAPCRRDACRPADLQDPLARPRVNRFRLFLISACAAHRWTRTLAPACHHSF